MITNKDKAECAEREVRQRQRVYPRWVQDGRMTADFARRQTEIMQAIAEDYRAKADAEDQAGRLL